MCLSRDYFEDNRKARHYQNIIKRDTCLSRLISAWSYDLSNYTHTKTYKGI